MQPIYKRKKSKDGDIFTLPLQLKSHDECQKSGEMKEKKSFNLQSIVDLSKIEALRFATIKPQRSYTKLEAHVI